MRLNAARAVACGALGLTMVMITANVAGAVWTAPWFITEPTEFAIGVIEFDFDDPIETDCTEELVDQVFGVDLDGDDDGGTWSIVGAVWDDVLEEWVPGSVKTRFRFPSVNRLFQVDFGVLAGAGVFAPPAVHNHPVDPAHPANEPNLQFATDGPLHVTLQMRIYELTEPDCEKDDLICTMSMRLVSTWGYGYIAAPPSQTPGDWIQMGLTTEATGGIRPVAVGGSCDTDMANLFIGQPTSFGPLTVLGP